MREMKKVWPIAVVIAAVLVCLYYADRAFQSGAKLDAAKKDYAELKKAMDADHEIQQGIIEGAEARIDEQNVTISGLRADVAVKQAELDRLAALVAQPVPPSTPDVEALPTVIALRGQVSTLTKMVTEARGIIAGKDKVIAAWTAKFDAQVEISAAWKRQYENERAVRIAAEEMFKLSERRRGAYSLATKAALVLGAAGVLYGLSK